MLSCKRLVLVATAVRVVYLAGTLLLAHYLDDYDTSSTLLSDSCEDSWPELVAKTQQQYPWVVWDSVFLHRISACGYEYEQFFAFFPALPGLVRLLHTTAVLPSPFGFSIIALLLNNALFLLSVVLLARLSQELLQDDRLAATAVLVFIASPASIHHSMLYTEALFTATSWLGLYCLYCRGSSLTASLAFAGSAATRSNGLLNAGFLLHEHGRRFLKAWPVSKASAAWQALQGATFSAVTVAPYFAYMLFGYNKFCTGVYEHQPRPWCSKTLPSAYGYVQDVYWNVGFMRYYEINQIPNFLLAAPTLIMSLWGPLAYACANPHWLVTGGLLSQQQLGHWLGSSSSSSSGAAGSEKTDQDGSSSDIKASSKGGASSASSSRSCAVLPCVTVGLSYFCSARNSSTGDGGDASDAAEAAEAAGAGAAGACGLVKHIPGVAYQPLRLRQLEVSANKQQGQLSSSTNAPNNQQLDQTQQQQQPGQLRKRTATEAVYGEQLLLLPSRATDTGLSSSSSSSQRCSCGSGRAYYSPRVAVFVIHWLFLTLVCLAVVHIQVATRFLSSCAPLYWFAAALMLHKGGLLRWLLWWYCFAFMGVGAVFFTNFYPWT